MFLYAVLGLWLCTTVLVLFEKRSLMVVIYIGAFGLLASIAFMLLGAPDVAIAEAAVSSFTTIFFVVCLEKYYGLAWREGNLEFPPSTEKKGLARHAIPLVFSLALCALFIYFIPGNVVNPYLKDLYMSRFAEEAGGLNPVAAILLYYRVYDTLFEALMLVVAVVGCIHLSKFEGGQISDGKHSEMEESDLTKLAIWLICPAILLFGVFVIVNGHLSAGGGFQGGLIIALFFIARYMVYNVYDLPINTVGKAEELVFLAIMALSAIVVFQGMGTTGGIPLAQSTYLVAMNLLIGLKVACGFVLLFYRFVAIERNDIGPNKKH